MIDGWWVDGCMDGCPCNIIPCIWANINRSHAQPGFLEGIQHCGERMNDMWFDYTVLDIGVYFRIISFTVYIYINKQKHWDAMGHHGVYEILQWVWLKNHGGTPEIVVGCWALPRSLSIKTYTVKAITIMIRIHHPQIHQNRRCKPSKYGGYYRFTKTTMRGLKELRPLVGNSRPSAEAKQWRSM